MTQETWDPTLQWWLLLSSRDVAITNIIIRNYSIVFNMSSRRKYTISSFWYLSLCTNSRTWLLLRAFRHTYFFFFSNCEANIAWCQPNHHLSSHAFSFTCSHNPFTWRITKIRHPAAIIAHFPCLSNIMVSNNE